MTTSSAGLWGWSRRNNPERFETMTLASVSVLFGLEILAALAVLTQASLRTDGWALGYAVLASVHAVLGIQVFRSALLSVRDSDIVDRRRVAVLVALTVALWAIAGMRYQPPDFDPVLTWSLLVPAAGLAAAVSPLPPVRYLVLFALALLAPIAVVLMLAGAPSGQLVALGFSGILLLLTMALSCRMSVWMMAVVWELDDARAVAGRLAVAEERLRFSRDLHDVFGRTLSTVAVKSELAAALAQRGDPRGPAEMLEVRRIAHEALREVREVAQGYRAADLDTEIAGARELLRSAGVECRVAGEGLDLPEPVAEAFAWVVRETVTNVVRHSRATRCDIDVRDEPGWYRVLIRNDGAAEDGQPRSGSGLAGLRERLASRGGEVAISSDGGLFVVEARLPGGAVEEAS